MRSRAVVGFGCPRSGTTFLQKALRSLRGVYTAKLVEHAKIHPCHSENGLINLAGNLRSPGVTFVRIVRHPIEVADSFVATRSSELTDLTGTIPKYSDDVIVRWITSESENSTAQRPWFGQGETHGSRWVEVRYENLATEEGQTLFVEAVCRDLTEPEENAARLSKALEAFGDPDEAANYGRLSHGVDWAMNDEQAAWFLEKLASVMEREGYER